MVIDWKQKLSSKKFWCALIACVAAVAAALGLSEGSVEKITAIIGAFATLITYILVEGNIDAKRVETTGGVEFTLDADAVAEAIVEAINSSGAEETEGDKPTIMATVAAPDGVDAIAYPHPPPAGAPKTWQEFEEMCAKRQDAEEEVDQEEGDAGD